MVGALVLLTLLIAAPRRTAAAEAYDNCTGFIDALPATITTQGTWCLRKDLATSMSSGEAINISASNVTIDCNGFKIGGLSAPMPFEGYAIRTPQMRSNVVVRDCVLRGFFTALFLTGDGHLIENNRVDSSRSVGLWVNASQSIIRDNRVTFIGYGGTLGSTTGIVAQGEGTLVERNHVSDLFGTEDPDGDVSGIGFYGADLVIRENVVHGLDPGAGAVEAIGTTSSPRTIIERNVVTNAADEGLAIRVLGSSSSRPVCIDNRVRGFGAGAYGTCIDGGGNFED